MARMAITLDLNVLVERQLVADRSSGCWSPPSPWLTGQQRCNVLAEVLDYHLHFLANVVVRVQPDFHWDSLRLAFLLSTSASARFALHHSL